MTPEDIIYSVANILKSKYSKEAENENITLVNRSIPNTWFIIIGCIFLYISFASELLCKVFGLIYPAYIAYVILQQRARNTDLIFVAKYMIIYTEIETVTFLLYFLYFPWLVHIKTIMFVGLSYCLHYRLAIINDIYNSVLLFNRTIYNLAYRYYERLKLDIKKSISHARKY